MEGNKREYKRRVKRTAWFLGVYFVFALFFCAFLQVVGIKSAVLNGFILIVTAGIFYLLFLWICAKIDKKREEEENEKPKDFDPFAD